MLHPPDVIQILYFLEYRQVTKVNTRQWTAGGLAYARTDTLRFRDTPIFGNHQSQPIANQ
jgi:hypothetical protein